MARKYIWEYAKRETGNGKGTQRTDLRKSANGNGVSNSPVKICKRMCVALSIGLSVCTMSPEAQRQDFPVQIIALDRSEL